MIKQGLVSIIMPVYNAENTIESSIRSIVNQSYKEIELIVINDGSNDESESICKQLAEEDSRIKYYSQDNAGPSAARNLGLKVVKGEYVAFIDSDDTFNEKAIEMMLLKGKDADLVIAGYQNIKEQDKRFIGGQVIPDELTGEYTKQTFLDQYSHFFEAKLIHYIWHKLYRSDYINTLKFDESIKIGEDLVFNLNYIDRINKIKAINEIVTFHVKDNDQSLTKIFQTNLFEYRKLIYSESRSFLIRHNKWTEKNEETLNRYFAKKFYTTLQNYFQSDSPLTMSEKTKVSQRIINDTLVQELNPWFGKYSLSAKWLGLLIKKKMIRSFTLFAAVYFNYVSLRDKRK